MSSRAAPPRREPGMCEPDTLPERERAFRWGFEDRLRNGPGLRYPEGINKPVFELGVLTAEAVLSARGEEAAWDVCKKLHGQPAMELQL